MGDFNNALANYDVIITAQDSIYIDEALIFRQIYNINLKTRKASTYEEMIFKHEDSIYCVDSRIYRKLRGDTNL